MPASAGREERSAAVSAEENKAVLRRWIEAYNERDLEVEAAVLARDYVAHVPAAPGPLEGLEAWRQFSGSFAEACSLTFGSRRRTSCRSSTRLPTRAPPPRPFWLPYRLGTWRFEGNHVAERRGRYGGDAQGR